MSAQNTAGRLTADTKSPSFYSLKYENGEPVFWYDRYDDGLHFKEDDARRLAACWNACQGLSTESLERSDMLSSMNQQRRQLTTQHDQLLAAALAARRTAKLVTDEKGHELIAVEPQLWRDIQAACRFAVQRLPADDAEGGAA